MKPGVPSSPAKPKLQFQGAALPPCLEEFRRARLSVSATPPGPFEDGSAPASPAAVQEEHGGSRSTPDDKSQMDRSQGPRGTLDVSTQIGLGQNLAAQISPSKERQGTRGGNGDFASARQSFMASRSSVIGSPAASGPAVASEGESSTRPRKRLARLKRHGTGWEKPAAVIENVAALLVALVSDEGVDEGAQGGRSRSHARSVALVVDCIDSMLMRGGAEASRCVTDEGLQFLSQTLRAVAEAASSELQSTHSLRQELMLEAEKLRAQLRRKGREFQDTHERVGKVLYLPKRQALETEAALEAATEELDRLKVCLQEDSSKCDELRQQVTHTLKVAREEWAAERQKLVAKRDEQLAALAQINETLPQLENELQELLLEASKTKEKADRYEKEANKMVREQEKLLATDAEYERLGNELRQARLESSLTKKPGTKRKKKAK